ncbi:MAG: leucine-rich repeat domain-containing protein, partial [Clostridia bacterium]|nr:leucine-rich repeat domain-containing protein [Clostridia bacterium]
MTKRIWWKIALLGILAACTAAGLVLLHKSGVSGAVTEACADEAAAVAEDDGTVTEGILSYTLSDDGLYYILNGFASGTTADQKATVNVPDAIGDIPVTEIAEKAFNDQTAITSLTTGANVVKYGTGCFAGLTNLENLYYNATAEYNSQNTGSVSSTSHIFDSMGADTEKGTTVTVSAGVSGIPSYFFYASANNSVHINVLVFEDISGFSYFGTEAFKSVAAGDGVYIDNLDAWCNVTMASQNAGPLQAFHNLYVNGQVITDVVVPENVTSVSGYLFYGARNIKSVTIHENVTSIGAYAFSGCDSLQYVYFNAQKAAATGIVFGSTGSADAEIQLVIG